MKRITVFGSFNYDMTARMERFPKPGETLMGLDFVTGPGGKGSNQAIAAKRAGAELNFITKIGTDAFGKEAMKTFDSEGIGAGGVIVDPALPTGSAFILLDNTSRQNMIVVNKGASSDFHDEDIAAMRPLLESTDILLIQLETNISAVESVIGIVKNAGGIVILNPAPAAELSQFVYENTDIITPNETEVELLTGVSVDSPESADEAARILRERGVRQVVITLGSNGAYAHDRTSAAVVRAYPVQPVDTTGAGDTFNGAMTAALAEGKSLFEAVNFANAAASISVSRPGAGLSAPFREEIDSLLNTCK